MGWQGDFPNFSEIKIMLNQLFSEENFRKILDYENRKGRYLEGRFFPESRQITEELKECTAEIKNLKRQMRTLGPDTQEAEKLKRKIDELGDSRKVLREEKEKSLTDRLEKISYEINKKNFSVGLREITVKGKTAYACSDDAAAYFALKQLQLNIRRLYKVKQGNRNNIICQLREVLNNSFPKFLLRTDIKNFFESIPRDKLVKKLEEDPLLTTSSKKIIKQILRKYGNLSGRKEGIPRGVGISAYLAELFMRDFDEKILSRPDVIFYARYVDDIVVVFSPGTNSDAESVKEELLGYMRELGLSENQEKTKLIDMTSGGNRSFQYLGYRISLKKGKVSLSLSRNRVRKYEKRIELSFSKYKSGAATNEKQARKILVKRIRFLTGNTRLLNNKRNILVGVYFSNRLLSCLRELAGLDRFLENEIMKIPNRYVRSRLLEMSFVEGFRQKRFAGFSPTDLRRIVEVWKHAET